MPDRGYKSHEPVEINCRVKHETDRAYLIVVDSKELWVPKSCCTDNGDGTMTMPEWLAFEKELI